MPPLYEGPQITGRLTPAAAAATGLLTGTPVMAGGGDADIVGRGLIVHKDPDDFTTQPTGNSGARVACGVIARS